MGIAEPEVAACFLESSCLLGTLDEAWGLRHTTTPTMDAPGTVNYPSAPLAGGQQVSELPSLEKGRGTAPLLRQASLVLLSHQQYTSD